MKWSYEKLWDLYDAKANGVPGVQVKPIDTEAVLKRVQEQVPELSQGKSDKSRSRMRLVRLTAGITAAVVLVAGGTTLAAAESYGGVDQFFQSLFGSNVAENPETLEPYVTTPSVSFDSTNAAVQWTLLGMYGDDASTLLSFSVTVANGDALPEYLKAAVVSTVTDAEGNSETLTQWGNTVDLKKSEDDSNVYYANFRIEQGSLSGKTLDVTFYHLYTESQIETIYNQQTNGYEELQKAYCLEELGVTEEEWDALEDGALPSGFDIDAWKTYRETHHLEETEQVIAKECYEAGENTVEGSWHASIALDFQAADPITAEYDGGTVTLRSMSATIAYPETWELEDSMVDFILTLKDGRKILSDYSGDTTTLTTYLQAVESCKDDTADLYLPVEVCYTDGTDGNVTICYSEPVEPEDIVEIRAVHSTYSAPYETEDGLLSGGYTYDSETVIYTAE